MDRVKCGKPAGPMIPRWGWSFACVLDKGHDGECQRGGTCKAHGEYVGNDCPQWPNCIKDILKTGIFEESFLVTKEIREKPMTGVERIAAERQRQIDVESWSPEHDDQHKQGELAEAASSYCDLAAYQTAVPSAPKNYARPMGWPFESHWWKPSDDPIRNLEKAGALITAEIDRLQRAKEGNVIATITTPITDEIRSILSEAESADCVHLSEIGEVKEDDLKALESLPTNPTLKFDHWSIPKEKH